MKNILNEILQELKEINKKLQAIESSKEYKINKKHPESKF